MQQTDIDRTINLLFKHSDLLLKSATVLTDTLYGLLNYLSNGYDTKLLNKHLKNGGKFEFLLCETKAAPELEMKLKREGVPYICSSVATIDGKKMFLYADKDARLVERVVNEYRCEHNKGGLHSKDIVYTYANGDIHRIKGLDRYEATLFIEYAKQQGIFVAVEAPDRNTYQVVYASGDRHIMDNIKMTIAIQKTYPKAYHALKEQIDYEDQCKSDLISKAQKHETNVPLYLVDFSGNYFIVTADKATYHEYGGAESVIDYMDYDRDEKIAAFISTMDNPRELNPLDFNKYEEAGIETKKDIVKAADLGRPTLSLEEVEDIRKMLDERQLYELKLAQDNPEQEIYGYAYTNSEMRMASFEEMEQINGEAVHDKKEFRETAHPILYDDARSMYRGFRDEDEHIDMEAEKYADAVMDGRYDELEKLDEEFSRDDLATEIMNDLNANMIPDDRETDYMQ